MVMVISGPHIEIDLSKAPALERAMVWLEWLLAPGPVSVTVIEALAYL